MTTGAIDAAVVLALIGIVGTVITALFKLLANNTQAFNRIADSSNSQLKEAKKSRLAQEKAANEAEKRNGHLGEQNLKLAKLVTAQNKDIVQIKTSSKKIADILSKSANIAAEDRETLLSPDQHVDTQIVDEQIIKKKNVK